MKQSSGSLCLFIFTLIKITSSNFKENENLILEVFEYYKCSSIIFFYSNSESDLTERNEILDIAVYFSKKKILSLFIAFEEPYTYKYSVSDKAGKSRTQLPMNVIFFTTENSFKAYFQMFDQIDNVTSSKYTYPTHNSLMLFMKPQNKNVTPLIDFCTNPIGNPINLRFDSLLIVKCYDDNNIREWYTLNENQTIVYDLATWDTENGLVLKTNLGKYERRGGLKGKKLRMATSEHDVILKRKGDSLEGFMGRIFELIKQSVNFTMDFVGEEDVVGTWNEDTGTWSGVVGHIINNNIDLAASDASLTSDRLHHVDCTVPLMVVENFLYLKKPPESIRWTGYIKTFDKNFWIFFGLFILTCTILLTMMKMKIRESYFLPPLILENYVNVWGIFCQQGLNEFPSQTPLRVAYLSIFLLSVIIWGAFCASLTSLINVPNTELTFKSVQEFITDKSNKLIVLKDSAEYAFFKHQTIDEELIAMNSLMMERSNLPRNIKEGFDMVCEQKVALYISSYLKELIKDQIKCGVYQISTNKFDNVGLILRKNSEYTEIINYHIHRMKNFGLIHQLQQSYLKIYLNKKLRRRDTFTKVDFSVVTLPFAIIGCGLTLGVTILWIEKSYFYLKNTHHFRLLVWRFKQLQMFLLNDEKILLKSISKK